MSNARQDEWAAKSDCGEYVRKYNPTGCVMAFTTDDREAAKTTDDREAAEWCRIAADVYGRKDSHKRMRLRMV
jgi:hypothetical protein